MKRFCVIVVVFLVSVLCAGLARAGGPAVSAPNGVFDFNAGVLEGGDGAGLYGSVAGALSLPLGSAFGIEADLGASVGSGATFGGALHTFTRDPESHLFGVAGAFLLSPHQSLAAGGPEVELYFGRLSLEAWGGMIAAAYDDAAIAGRTGGFIRADLAYYPTDDLRLSVGIASMLGREALHLGGEYLWRASDWPLALTAEAALRDDGDFFLRAGLRVYFGGAGKSLLARHREDDPRNRSFDLADGLLAGAAGGGGDDGDDNDNKVDGGNDSDGLYGPELCAPSGC